MSNEYSAPPVLLFEAAGIGASVTSRRPLSSGVGVAPLVCACAADRTSKEASAPRPKSLPHRAMAPCRDASRLFDIPLTSPKLSPVLAYPRRGVPQRQAAGPLDLG